MCDGRFLVSGRQNLLRNAGMGRRRQAWSHFHQQFLRIRYLRRDTTYFKVSLAGKAAGEDCQRQCFLPVVSLLFKPAFYTLSLVLITVALFYRKQRKQAYICLFPLTYFGTMLLGPTVQFRYVLPIMISVPLLAALLCTSGKEENRQAPEPSAGTEAPKASSEAAPGN